MPASKMKTQDIEGDLGGRLKELRGRRSLSLRALAERARVTFGAVSQIENGRSSPSVSPVKKILTALGTTLGEFFASEQLTGDRPHFIIRAPELVNVATGPGLTYLSLPGPTGERELQLMDERYASGAGTGSEHYTHAGTEGGFCIEGAVELTVQGRRELLGPGDAYYFDSTLPHGFQNAGSRPARIISACTPPSF